MFVDAETDDTVLLDVINEYPTEEYRMVALWFALVITADGEACRE